MKKYKVSIPWHATYFVDVEAENEEEAKIKALNEGYPQLCHQCNTDVQIDEPNDESELTVYDNED